MVAYCEPCGCNVSPNLLAQHNRGRKHLRKVASIGVPNPVTSLQPPPPPSNLPNARPVSLPNASSPATNVLPLDTSDPRVTVSHEDGLDFVVEGTEIARGPHFPPVDLAILIEKTEVESSLSIDKVQLFRAPDTAESWCFDAKNHAESSCRFKRHMLAHSACAYKSSSTIIPGRAVKSSRCSASYAGVLPSQAIVLAMHILGNPLLETTWWMKMMMTQFPPQKKIMHFLIARTLVSLSRTKTGWILASSNATV
ncbi:hypothetical protein EDB89DRAFT_2003049 [Lactarius sanguifluus]|nr:hypothetical protein EDB89DRAFT_2003049 [Lactarius sanguifluus]